MSNEENTERLFNKIFKKRANYETIIILNDMGGRRIKQKLFIDLLVERLQLSSSNSRKSKISASGYYRGRSELLKHDLINIERDESGEFTLSLTKRGKIIADIIREIEELLNDRSEESSSFL